MANRYAEHIGSELRNVYNGAKDVMKQQRDVEKEYREGNKGAATEKAEKEGKSYHPFTGLTF